MAKLKKNLAMWFILVLMLIIVINSKEILECAKRSLSVCFSTVIPSLFPFMVLSSLFVSACSDDSNTMISTVTSKLFGISKSANAAFICGLICGYPIGAKCSAELFKAKKISASEAESLIAYSNNSGPLFVIGAVGVGILHSLKAGVLLYTVQIMYALCAAKVLKAHTTYSVTKSKKNVNEKINFVQSVRSAVTNVLNVCGFIVFFSVINELAKPFAMLLPRFFRSVFFCILEITNSVLDISEQKYPYPMKLSLISFALGWSGISVHMQVKSLLGGTGLKMKKYYITRFFIGLFSAVTTYIISAHFDILALFVYRERLLVSFVIFISSFICISKRKKREKALPQY